jgi:hypothetical protein
MYGREMAAGYFIDPVIGRAPDACAPALRFGVRLSVTSPRPMAQLPLLAPGFSLPSFTRTGVPDHSIGTSKK